MARKKNGAGGFVLGALVLGLYFLSKVPKEVWVLIGVVAGVSVCVVIFSRMKASSARKQEVRRAEFQRSRPVGGADPIRTRRPGKLKHTYDHELERANERTAVVEAARAAGSGRTPEAGSPVGVPESASRFMAPKRSVRQVSGAGRWVPAHEKVSVAGAVISGGMIYVGTSLATASGTVDPCLIDPDKTVAVNGSFLQRDMGYWPSYSNISATARCAYLNWLASGRGDPAADVGYVFLYFYGLERRLITDAAVVTSEERRLIGDELRRLLGIYGGSSSSFRRYAGDLLDWVSISECSSTIYNDAVPSFERSIEVPLYVRLALGQTAVDKVPVPAHLALAWARLDPVISLRTPVVRCADEFDRLFVLKYANWGEGILLPKNRSRLRLVYKPASAGFRGQTITLSFGDTPDVTALTSPQKKLQLIVDATTEALEAYSRAIGRSPEAAGTLEGILQLPTALWPEKARGAIEDLKTRVGSGMLSMSFQELQVSLDAASTLTRDRTLALARALEGFDIGVEPDVIGGARTPKPDDKLVLFAMPSGQPTSSGDASYKAAALTLDLAAAVAAADGNFSAGEMALLRRQIHSWNHLSEGHNRRLLAHLRLLMLAPVPLSMLKRKLEPLDASAKETLAVFMATVAASDGEVSPKEIRLLESIYKALDIDVSRVFSDVHAVVAHAEDLAARRSAAAKRHAPSTVEPAQATEPVAISKGIPPSVVPAEQSVEDDTTPAAERRGVPVDDEPVQMTEGAAEPVFRIPSAPTAPPAIALPLEVPRASDPASTLPPSRPEAPEMPEIPVYVPPPQKPKVAKLAAPGFKLDSERIAALRKDTERVSALLAGIFQDDSLEEQVQPATPPPELEAASTEDGRARLLGLDDAHAAFARMLISRPQWSRDELQDLATDLELMLDGALERINEAAFDIHDVPFTEGDDPVDVNPEVLEKIAA